MTRLILIATVFMLVSGNASYGKTYTDFLSTSCSDFTHFYARSGLEWRTTKSNAFPSWKSKQFGYRLNYIFGYMTYATKHVLPPNGILGKGMRIDQIISWIGSWCRDHPSDPVTECR